MNLVGKIWEGRLTNPRRTFVSSHFSLYDSTFVIGITTTFCNEIPRVPIRLLTEDVMCYWISEPWTAIGTDLLRISTNFHKLILHSASF